MKGATPVDWANTIKIPKIKSTKTKGIKNQSLASHKNLIKSFASELLENNPFKNFILNLLSKQCTSQAPKYQALIF